MIIEALETGKAEWAPAGPRAMKDVCAVYDRQSAEIVPAMEGPACGALGRRAGILRRPAPRIADGVELLVRHRAPPRPDHDVSAPDGIDRAAGLRPERREP